MRIDRKKLIEQLASRSGLDAAEAEKKLDELTEEIRRTSREEGSFELHPLGTFTADEETLAFSPSAVLETELNQTYTGMQPIELIGAYQRQAAGAAEVSGSDVVEAEETGTADAESTPAASVGRGTEKSGEEDKIPAAPAVTEAGSEESPAVSSDPGAGTASAAEAVVEKEDKRAQPGKRKRNPGRRRERGKDPIGTILAAAVVALLVLVGGWLAYEYGMTDAGVPDSPSTETAESEAGSAAEEEQEAPDEADPQNGGPAGGSEETEADPWGLTGSTDPDAGGYTLIVHSLRNEGVARELGEELSSADFRVVLQEAMVDGTRYWRIGLGQFETIADAQGAAGELPERYRENHFIRRIQ